MNFELHLRLFLRSAFCRYRWFLFRRFVIRAAPYHFDRLQQQQIMYRKSNFLSTHFSLTIPLSLSSFREKKIISLFLSLAPSYSYLFLWQANYKKRHIKLITNKTLYLYRSKYRLDTPIYLDFLASPSRTSTFPLCVLFPYQKSFPFF